MSNSSPVTAIVVTYAPQADVLDACLDSLRAQRPAPHIFIADNLSPSDPKHEVSLGRRSDDCTVLACDRNHGFGGAIMRALNRVSTPYVLISNFDIVYDPGYVATALGRLESSGREVVGVAGKTLFYPPVGDPDWPGRGPDDPPLLRGRGTGAVIDNTGTLVNGLMLAYNRGVGQIDIGQYDIRDRPMGACFAAFLARRNAFKPLSQGGVGGLDTGYFMYYEDIDWCYRANLLGYQIAYEPGAVAWHHHSLTTREKSLFFKYHLIQRNLYRTIIKNMRFRSFVKLWALHSRLHIRRARVETEFGPVTWRILSETLAWAPVGLVKRAPIQIRRKVSDTDIINLSIGEEGHLDDVALKPQENWLNPLASLERLRKHFPDDPACELIPVIKRLSEGHADSGLADEVRRRASEICPALMPLLERITV